MSSESLHHVEISFLDLDDHLVDTGSRLLTYHIQLYKEVTGRQPPDEFVLAAEGQIGGRAEEVFAALWPDSSPQHIRAMRSRFREIATEDQSPGEVLPGVPDELDRLAAAALRMQLVTNRGTKVKEVLRAGDINPNNFEAIHVPATGELPNIPGVEIASFSTKADAIRRGLGKTAAHLATMSGDSPSDIQQGNLVNVTTIGVPFRVASARELYNADADYVVRDFPQMGRMLRP